MHSPRSITESSEVAGARSEQSTTITWAPCSAKAVHSRSSITPPNAMCGFATTGTMRTRAWANIWRRPWAWSWG